MTSESDHVATDTSLRTNSAVLVIAGAAVHVFGYIPRLRLQSVLCVFRSWLCLLLVVLVDIFDAPALPEGTTTDSGTS